MPLWKKSTSVESRPKFLRATDTAEYKQEHAFATQSGWSYKAGTSASGNDNTSATPEILVAMGGLAATLGAANILSVDFTAGEYARTETFDIALTFDEAITVTSVAWSADQVYSNKVYFTIANYGPTDMVDDGSMQMQYYSGSGTNRLVFRGTIPGTAVAGGYLGHTTYTLGTNGSSAMVDSNGTAVTEGDMAGGSAIGGPAGSAELFGNAVLKTGSTTVYTEETKAGTTSGSAQILYGVTTAES
jgi:hypothetical protein|tara:strand:- start:3353 stop:4087 length:735 start_codon:yes stop_codon:yes gene_type:complete